MTSRSICRLGEQRHFDEADAFVIADHRDLLSVKISAVDDHFGVGKNQRIVRAGVEFARDDFGDVPVRFLKCAENLRRAAERIRVLNFRAGINGFGRRAPLMLVNALRKIRMRAKRITDAVGDKRLAAKTARLVDLLAKNFRFAAKNLKQTGREQFHPAQNFFRFV